MAPPKVRFLTKIYHPNIDKLGKPVSPPAAILRTAWYGREGTDLAPLDATLPRPHLSRHP